MSKIFICCTLVVLAVSSAPVFAQHALSTEPLPFKNWKEQQIVDAQNQVARISNRIVLLKAGKVRPEDISAEFNDFEDTQADVEAAKLTSKAQKLSSNDILARLEKELSGRQKSLEFAKDLGFEEYFLGYLTQFQENPDALASVAGRLSKDEVAELLKVLLKSNQSSLDSGSNGRLRATLKKLEAAAL